jgi:L-2-hydroxyglutarate oxidase LhgO
VSHDFANLKACFESKRELMSADVETIVVGAGVVGLAIANALAAAGQEVIVLEQHGLIGSETSSRNSEVIHAGIYYPPGSLRARLCVEGKARLYRFCEENGVAYRRCGKLIVATAEDQLPKLHAIRETAARNGVDDLVPLSAEQARQLEPEVACVAALLSPSTGIIDSHGLMLALEGHAEARGAQIVLNSPVAAIRAMEPRLFALVMGSSGERDAGVAATEITCRNLVVSAGLHASRLAATLTYPSGYTPPATYFAKGQYYALSGKSPFTRHIYPMPQGAWLGLHATIDLSGRCKFGPDIAWIPEIDYSFEPEKLTQFLSFIRTYYPALDPDRLHPDYTGIRPKLYREGEPVPDFAIHGEAQHGHPGLVMLFGIESPGLTAALAIGELIARLLSQNRSP